MAAQTATRGRAHATRGPRGGGLLLVGLVALLVLGLGAAFLAVGTLEVQAAATKYVTAESLWSKGHGEAVRALTAYAASGERAQLRQARQALAIPLTFRAARRALAATPIERDAARAQLLATGIDEAGVHRMVLFYRLFADTPVMAEAVEVWRRADEPILRLVAIADELEIAWADGDPGELASGLFAEIATVNATLRPLELRFAHALADGTRRLRGLLQGIAVVVLLLMVLSAGGVIAWAYRRLLVGERNLRATYEQAAVGMALLDRSQRFTDANDAFCRLLGVGRAALVGTPLRVFAPASDPPAPDLLRALVDAGEAGDGVTERRFVRRDGTTIWGRMTVSEIDMGGRDGLRFFAIVEDVSEAHRLADELDYRARHDTLTGLINRYEVERRLEAAVASATRHGDAHTLCFVDLDDFKLVNDTAGHDAGDQLLRQVASLLTRSVRTNDVVGRLGGDEFAILLDRANLEEARGVVEKLRRTMSDEAFHWGERVFDVTCSIGYVEITPEDPDPAAWMRRADVACYLAKEAGRDRAHAYVEGDEALVERQDRMAWVGRIREALVRDGLVLHAQRIVRTGDAEPLRYELLLRIRDGEGRLHAPEAFLPAAERYGLAADLDRWVVGEVLATLARHPEHVARLGRLHVNLSAQAVADERFRTFLLEALDAADVPGTALCFEITEASVARNVGHAPTFLEALRERGCAVALDDFGSGLASFGHLESLPTDLVKIDGAFVRDLAGNALDRAIVRSVHEVARVLGRETVAEHVEDEASRAILEEIGVDHLQGDAIHPPEPWEALLRET